jgi:DNA modification methylase
MRDMPTASIDLVLTDPPWFAPAMHYQSRIAWQRNYGDLSPLKVWWEVIAKELRRLVKPTGHCLSFCNGDSLAAFYPGFYNQWPKLKTLVWNKTEPGLGAIWRGQHELIIAARGEKSRRKDDGKLRGDVLNHKASSSQQRDHPVEKPESLLIELIEATTIKENIVFDPYCGSGTTFSAALKLGRHFYGCDINPEYVKLANERIEKTRLEMSQIEMAL